MLPRMRETTIPNFYGHAKLLSRASAQQRATTTQTPRRPIGAGGVKGASRSRLSVRDHHTRSLCAESPAQTEQWNCWVCKPADHLLIERRFQQPSQQYRCQTSIDHASHEKHRSRMCGYSTKSRTRVASSRRQTSANRLRPSCVPPTPQLKRE
jgi:hypothetical protein